MKIAVIGLKGLPAPWGSIENYCGELYSRLVQAGNSVDLFVQCSYTGSKSLIPYYSKGVRVVPLVSFNFFGLDTLVSAALGAVIATKKQYDIIHFHTIESAIFCWLPRLLSSAKVIVTCHGLASKKLRKSSSFLRCKGEQAAVCFANALITVSPDLQTYFQKTYGLEAVYIPNAPTDYPESDPDFPLVKALQLQQGRYILFLGDLTPENRPELLLQAFKVLQPHEWKLVFVGKPSHTKFFTDTLLDLAASDPNILFIETQQEAQLAELVRGSGLFVLPSDLEELPLGMLEAMQEGIPILAANVLTYQSFLTEGRGLLFQAGNLESCLQSLNWAIQNLPEMQQIAQRAKQYVQSYCNWDQTAAETLKLYSKLQVSKAQKIFTLSFSLQLSNSSGKPHY